MLIEPTDEEGAKQTRYIHVKSRYVGIQMPVKDDEPSIHDR
jgi:hypothetical protein